ncbi:uncharacterized protein BDW43DRAFT_233656 [Aspergillus alliaceus]|uniref:uncharacterized protein n=1 Tax=Petromyces alliaceus TaxID=209559 RepID=UPI0012A5CA1D|nr:uncharacterized protein BDW43DRAFT_233656 [Aspergillus alliaceus]KAB8227968.1 hypothetical protein BDW43DRAFT_233656 [Aspergillus alliaceus]
MDHAPLGYIVLPPGGNRWRDIEYRTTSTWKTTQYQGVAGIAALNAGIPWFDNGMSSYASKTDNRLSDFMFNCTSLALISCSFTRDIPR